MLTNTGSSIGGVSRAISNSGSGQYASGSGLGQHAPPNVRQTNRASTSGVRCFGYGEIGHRQVDCNKQGKKALFVDLDDYEEDDAYVCEEPVFDGTDEGDEKVLRSGTSS